MSKTRYLLVLMAYLFPHLTAAGPVFDVRNYGAVGDGITDDGSAFQQALDAAAAMPGWSSVLIPAGYYRIDRTLIIADDVAIEGVGDKTVLKRGPHESRISTCHTVNGHLSDIAGKSRRTLALFWNSRNDCLTANTRIALRHFIIEGPEVQHAAHDEALVNLSSVNLIDIEELKFRRISGMGITVRNQEVTVVLAGEKEDSHSLKGERIVSFHYDARKHTTVVAQKVHPGGNVVHISQRGNDRRAVVRQKGYGGSVKIVQN